MPLDNDYAWMASAAYNDNRNAANKVDTDPGWIKLINLNTDNSATGFAAVVYQNIATGETVIPCRSSNGI